MIFPSLDTIASNFILQSFLVLLKILLKHTDFYFWTEAVLVLLYYGYHLSYIIINYFPFIGHYNTQFFIDRKILISELNQ